MVEILFVCTVLPQACVNFNSEFAAQDQLFLKRHVMRLFS